MDVACQFLTMLFDNGASCAGPDALISVWTMPDKRTTFHATADSAAGEALRRAAGRPETAPDASGGIEPLAEPGTLAPGHRTAGNRHPGAAGPGGSDVYFGCGLRRAGLKPSERGGAADVVALPGLWADLDVAGPGHVAKAGKRQFASLTDAAGFLAELQHRPSIVISSGGGLHAYWLFSEFLTIQTDAERADATALSRGWWQTLAGIAKARHDVDLDATWDLARVLRVPGTVNHKHSPPVPVEPAAGQDWGRPPARYDAADLRAGLVDWDTLTAFTAASRTTVSASLILALNRQPDAGKLSAWVANDRKFRDTWERARADLKDTSGSGYDMSLAAFGAVAGWSDQEIADLLILHRVKHGDHPEKALRLGYIMVTIARARNGSASHVADQSLAALPANAREIPDGDTSKRDEIVDVLRNALGVTLARWIQVGEEDPVFSLVLDDGLDIEIGGPDDVLNQRTFRARLYAAGKNLPVKKSGVWLSLCARLSEIREVVASPETTRGGRLAAYLADYTARCSVYGISGTDWWAGLSGRYPIWKDGCLHVNVPNLRGHVKRQMDETKITSAELYRLLRLAGAERTQLAWRVARIDEEDGEEELLQGKYWRIPAVFFEVEHNPALIERKKRGSTTSAQKTVNTVNTSESDSPTLGENLFTGSAENAVNGRETLVNKNDVSREPTGGV